MASPYSGACEKFVKESGRICNFCRVFLKRRNKKPRSMAGLCGIRLLPGTCRHLGQKFCFRPLGCRGLDLAGLNRVLAKPGLILRLAAAHAIVEWKFSPVVFDVRISHLLTPFQMRADTGKPFCLKKYRPPRLLRLAGHSWTCDSDHPKPDEWPTEIKHIEEPLVPRG